MNIILVGMGHALNGLFWDSRCKNIILVGMGHALKLLGLDSRYKTIILDGMGHTGRPPPQTVTCIPAGPPLLV